MTDLSFVEAKAISDRLRYQGFLMCTAAKVQQVADGESLEDSALESAILQELEA